MALFGSLFGKKQEDPMQYLNQIPEKTGQYLNPYIQEGRQAGTAAQGQYGQMAQDPMAFLNQIMSGYKPSQAYQYQQGVMGRELENTAAAGGFRGTNEDERKRAELINSLMGQDMQQYLNNVLGIQGTGLQGQELGAGRGFQASSDMASITGSNLGQQATLSAQQENQKRQTMQSLMKLLPMLAGMGLGGIAAPAGMGAMGALQGLGVSQGMNLFGNNNQSGVTGNF